MPQPLGPLPRRLLLVGAGLFACSLAGFLALANMGGYDFSVYLLGGEALRSGQPVYDQQIHSQWGAGYFTYPPVTLLLYGPMSTIPDVAYVAMFVVEIGALLAVAWLSLHLLGCPPGAGTTGAALAAAAVALWLQPIFDSIHEGKLELILMALVLADFALRARRWPTGVLIGVATAMKITPGIFIVFLLLTRRYRAAAVAGGTWAALTALGFAAAWSDSVRFWFAGTFADADRVASPLTIDSVLNQSLRSVLVRLLGDGAEPGWYVIALAVAAGGLAVAVRAYRREGPLAGVLAAALTGLLVSPVSWHEHWVWVLPVLIFLADAGRRIYRRGPALAIALPSVTGAVFLAWPLPTGEPGRLAPASILSPANHAWFDEGSRSVFVALAGAAYVLVGVMLLMAGAWLLRGNCRIPVSLSIRQVRRVLGRARPG